MMGPRDYSRIKRSSEDESEDEEEAQGEEIEERTREIRTRHAEDTEKTKLQYEKIQKRYGEDEAAVQDEVEDG